MSHASSHMKSSIKKMVSENKIKRDHEYELWLKTCFLRQNMTPGTVNFKGTK